MRMKLFKNSAHSGLITLVDYTQYDSAGFVRMHTHWVLIVYMKPAYNKSKNPLVKTAL